MYNNSKAVTMATYSRQNLLQDSTITSLVVVQAKINIKIYKNT